MASLYCFEQKPPHLQQPLQKPPHFLQPSTQNHTYLLYCIQSSTLLIVDYYVLFFFNMSSKQTLKCPHPGCLMWYTNVAAYRQHIRHHPKQRSLPPPSPPDKLFSRRSHDTADGAFDFLHILDEDNEISFDTEPDPDSDVDSYYSDSGTQTCMGHCQLLPLPSRHHSSTSK